MYRLSTPEYRGRPLYRVCARCGRNDHKVAVYYAARNDRPFGIEHHPIAGYCTSCFAEDFDYFTRMVESGRARIVYDRRGKVGKAKHPAPKRPDPNATRAVYATDYELHTFRVSEPLAEIAAQALWQRLDDRRRAGQLGTVKFVEVRDARYPEGVDPSDRDYRYALAPYEPSLIS